jgi:hypothetical protein
VKIKLIKDHDLERLETKANCFIEYVKVISTQLSIRPAPNESFTQYVLLITYED